MTGKLKLTLLTIALAAVAGCGDKTAAPAGGNAAGAGGDGGKGAPPANAGGGAKYDASKSTASISGSVKFTGAKPAPVKENHDSDPFCKTHAAGKDIWSERFVVNDDGSLPHSFVWVSLSPAQNMTGYPEPAKVTLDQSGCRYVPHIFGLRTNQSLTVKNSDQTTHNVHVHSTTIPEANKAQVAGAVDEIPFKGKEAAVPFQCDVHSWMKAYAFVVDHPFYAVTDASGKFKIDGLPAGTYKVKAWHESVTADGKAVLVAESDITVKDGEAKSQDFEVKAK